MGRRAPANEQHEVDLSWERAHDVEGIARDLIARHHPRLIEATVRAYYRPKARKVCQKTVVADIRLPSPLLKAICADLEFPVDYILTVGADRWAAIPVDRREPWIDHELEHAAGRDPETELWTLRTHDIEEFEAIVTRWGTKWRADLDGFARACMQMPLNLPGFSKDAP